MRRPEVPKGYAHPIDAFVRTRLAKEGLAPAPKADARTLLRRLYLDLTGLPPTPKQAKEVFEHGDYEKVVDQLLASERYAERQAMYWLDAVRYADTCGFHSDNPFPARPYRDYVLRSIRDNKRFDIFTQEQLAGDLMPAASTEQLVATAFNRMARTSAEGGLQPKDYLAKYSADGVRTVAGTWLGMTLGCVECHDHKFDPIFLAGRPSMGSWLLYGPGAESSHLPGFVVLLSSGRGGQMQPIAARQWSSGFLPGKYQGVKLNSIGDPVLYIRNPKGISKEAQKNTIDAVNALHKLEYEEWKDPDIQTRISQYELAFEMQASVRDLMDTSKETQATLDAYGAVPGDGSFASNCLLARRLAERGVRFIQIYHREGARSRPADGGAHPGFSRDDAAPDGDRPHAIYPEISGA